MGPPSFCCYISGLYSYLRTRPLFRCHYVPWNNCPMVQLTIGNVDIHCYFNNRVYSAICVTFRSDTMLRPTLRLLLLLLSLGFTTSTPAQADTILYVKPTEGTKCPGEPCRTLDEYVNETHHYEYFPYNNTVMKFLPGTHNLSEVFNFHHLTNLTLEATHPTMNETLIFCSDHPRILFFSNGAHISIKGLSMFKCKYLQFDSCAYITVSSVLIQLLLVEYNCAMCFYNVHNIHVSQVAIHNQCLHRGPLNGMHLYSVTGCSVFEQVEVFTLGADDVAMYIDFEDSTCIHLQCTIEIQNCSFRQRVVYDGYNLNPNGIVNIMLENVIFSHITGPALEMKQWEEGEGHATVILNNVTFMNNSYSGPTVEGAAVVNTWHINNVTFIDCEFYNNLGTPISADGSSLQFSGNIVFRNNTGYNGGAMSCTGGSHVDLSDNANVTFENNKAENVGGAVFVNQNVSFNTRFFIFLSTPDCPCPYVPFNITFINNKAQRGGESIYGGGVDQCFYKVCGTAFGPTWCLAQQLVHSSGLYFEPSLDSEPSQITSDPTQVCLCKNRTLNCSITTLHETHYPGEEFPIVAVDVGDMNGPVDGPVYAQILPEYSEAILGGLQHFQPATHTKCTELRYSILSKPGLVVMALTVNTARVLKYQADSSIVYFNIILLSCPLGFYLSDYPHQCICDTQLKRNNIPCNITTQTIQRSGTVWVNASFDGNISDGDFSDGVIVHKDCPFGYCKTEEVDVNLKHPDTQCAFHHSGTLCGACQPGLSLALGSPQCLSHCSNGYISLIIAFAAAGLVLVLFIKILDLTVAVGTINGLIFYANIVQAAHSTFFPASDTNILTVFIAWLNLDLGIETCFFHGLDGYWKTWLQFVFPFYIWAIILLIIYLSRCSQTVARIFGNNSVPVLATLILLSYAKLFRTIVSALTFTYLEFPDSSKTAVWSIDGNIQYLSPKHTPLFLVALGVLLFLWLPFTVFLLFEQCFQRIETYTVRKWMLRLKPFFDAYFGPLRGNHRYWVGVLLVARGILLLVFGPLNSANDPSVNLLAVNTVIVLLLMYTNYLPYGRTDMDGRSHFRFWIGSCYKKWYLSLFESSFLCNLSVLSAITLAKGNQAAVVYTSVGITFCQFIGIVVYQVYVIIRRSWKERQQGEGGGAQVN